MGEIASAGIKVSKFGFGAHMSEEGVRYPRERERMIREAHDLGINLFDIYNYQFFHQYEPMGRYIAPIKHEVVLSIVMNAFGGRTLEQQIEHNVRLFGRDYIDMVRIHAWSPDHPQHGERWGDWEKCFTFKEKGYVRAVGLPIHSWEDLNPVLEAYPIDFVIFPYNFYHNIAWEGHIPEKYDKLPELLRKRQVSVITMKPFAGDYLVTPLKKVADSLKEDTELNFAQAALRYVINSGVKADTTLAGMYNLNDVYENVAAFYRPEMSREERKLLKLVKETARTETTAWLPDHYKWLDNWAVKTPARSGNGETSG